MLRSIVGTIIGTFGGARLPIRPQDDYDELKSKNADAISRGWMLAMAMPWPRDAEKIWIWRVDWEFPSLTAPRDISPLMNMNGLWWKPWRPTRPPSSPDGNE